MPLVKALKQHKLLLDTHVWIWFISGNSILSALTRKAINSAKDREHLLISPISVWEICMLVERKRISLEMEVADWLNQWIESPGILTAEFSFQVALLSNRLPGSLHGDPADRILIATAYQESAVLVTADEKILSYGNNAFISVYNPA